LAALLSALNWYGVRLFARVNNVLTVVKIAVPLLTVVALVISGFAPHHLTDHGGFAPYGYGAVRCGAQRLGRRRRRLLRQRLPGRGRLRRRGP